MFCGGSFFAYLNLSLWRQKVLTRKYYVNLPQWHKLSLTFASGIWTNKIRETVVGTTCFGVGLLFHTSKPLCKPQSSPSENVLGPFKCSIPAYSDMIRFLETIHGMSDQFLYHWYTLVVVRYSIYIRCWHKKQSTGQLFPTPTGKGVHPPFHQLMGPNQSKLKSNMVNLLNKIETMWATKKQKRLRYFQLNPGCLNDEILISWFMK